MYSNRFAVSIKMQGQFREELANGTVLMPSGEYSLFLKNKWDRAAAAIITVDGENISGGGFIVPANGSVEIERPVGSDKKFLFVDLTSQEAKAAGKSGDNSDKKKGLIEVKFYLEKPQMWCNQGHYGPYPGRIREPRPWDDRIRPYYDKDNITRRLTCSASTERSLPDVTDGCTVEGSQSSQTFQNKYMNLESDFTSIILFLALNKNEKLRQPVEVVSSSSLEELERRKKILEDILSLQKELEKFK